MQEDTILPLALPTVGRKKVVAAFDCGRLTSDGGVVLLSLAEQRLKVAERLAAAMPDHRDPARVLHPLADILRARILAIACGYEDADDLDNLRTDPGLKLACGRLPDTGRDLPSQPTMSRWENAPDLREMIGLMRIMVGLYCDSYAKPPSAVTLDINDTCDVVHGHQQLALFIYVTWNQFGPSVTYCRRRHGDYRSVGRALACPGRRAQCARVAWHSIGPRYRPAHARCLLPGSC
nr:transposase [Acidisoma sp. S159]